MADQTFTSGQILTAAQMTTLQANSGFVSVAGGSFSAVTEILLDSVFTSAYRNYRFVFDCQTSAGGGQLSWQMRSGGSTIATTTYQTQLLIVENTTVSGGNSTGQTSIRLGANDAAGYQAMTMDIFCPQIAQPTRIISVFNRTSGKSNETNWAANTNSTSYDGMRISVTTGNMTGTYTLYGLRQP